MRTAVVLLIVGFLIMAGAIGYALIAGDFFKEAGPLLDLPWFHLSMIDLYVGFFLFSGWILFRERSRPIAIAWIFALLLLGNLTSCVYALVAALRAKGDWTAFWLGHRADRAEAAAPIA
jgi:prepilin signal peptidase PulO-like enzyme (type II secretory pathway)